MVALLRFYMFCVQNITFQRPLYASHFGQKLCKTCLLKRQVVSDY